MTTQDEHKEQILRDLATILSKDDDLMPGELPAEGAAYDRWNAARNELVEEFESRSASGRWAGVPGKRPRKVRR